MAVLVDGARVHQHAPSSRSLPVSRSVSQRWFVIRPRGLPQSIHRQGSGTRTAWGMPDVYIGLRMARRGSVRSRQLPACRFTLVRVLVRWNTPRASVGGWTDVHCPVLHSRHGRAWSCQCPALRGRRRCRMPGGLSTGPNTAAGLERSRRAHWKHGAYSREVRTLLTENRQRWRELWALLGGI